MRGGGGGAWWVEGGDPNPERPPSLVCVKKEVCSGKGAISGKRYGSLAFSSRLIYQVFQSRDTAFRVRVVVGGQKSDGAISAILLDTMQRSHSSTGMLVKRKIISQC